MSSCPFKSAGSSFGGRHGVTRPRQAIVVPETLRFSYHSTAPGQLRSYLGLRYKSAGPVCVADVVGSTSDERPSTERFLDVDAILSKFNPLTDNHLLVWEDSDDEDGAVQAELPLSGAWEDSSAGYQGLEYQPPWIDYRDGSESDDPDALRGEAHGYKNIANVVPFPREDKHTQATGTMLDDSLAGTVKPSAYSREAGFQEISVIELEERLATGQFSLLLDVRSRQEYESGHIAGASNLPLDPDLSAAVRDGSLDDFRDRPVAVICGSGMRSGQATVRLSKVYGFSNVTNVTGGMMTWTLQGLPVQVHQRPSGGSGGCGCGSSGGNCRN